MLAHIRLGFLLVSFKSIGHLTLSTSSAVLLFKLFHEGDQRFYSGHWEGVVY
jgi:hypothetical protein